MESFTPKLCVAFSKPPLVRPEGNFFPDANISKTKPKKQQWGGTGVNWELPSTSQPGAVPQAQGLCLQLTFGCACTLLEGFQGMRGGHCVPCVAHGGGTLLVSGWGCLGRGWHLEDIIGVTDPHFLSHHRAPQPICRVCTERPQLAPSPISTL